MSTNPPRDRLDEYFDGRLSPEERAEFEHAAAGDTSIAREREIQARIDAGLRRQFTPPSADALLRRLQSRPRVIPVWRRPALAAAAVLLLVATGTVMFRWLTADTPLDPLFRYQPRPLAQVYFDERRAGFEPLWECREPAEFRKAFVDHLGSGLAFASVPTGATTWGVSYSATSLSRNSVLVLARIDGQDILVVADRVENAAMSVPVPEGLHVHRKEVGALVLYEISPLPDAQLLPLLHSEP
ncbi:MAG: hypothetical protein HRU75_08335 [Planctomycetia bacterium]|nr:MAG: hypothetical protein HRU75_08335 [Planctomycetia bacterium]